MFSNTQSSPLDKARYTIIDTVQTTTVRNFNNGRAEINQRGKGSTGMLLSLYVKIRKQ